MTNFKPSSSFWSGPIPEEWTEPSLRHVARIKNGADYKEFQVEEGGFPVIGSGGEFARTSKFLHDGESVLLGRKGTVDKPLYVNGRFWTVDTMFYTAVRNIMLPKYLYYFTKTIPFDFFQTSTAVPSMTQDDLGSIRVPLPSLVVQERVVKYLDREITQIDELIGRQKRLIELLAEKRQAVITQAVTRGLDPSAPTKPSGIPFMGEVPSSWKVSRLGTWILRSIEGGYSPSASNEYPEDGEWGVLALGAVGSSDFFGGKVKSVDLDAEVPENLAIRQGDILLTRSNVRDRVGFAAVVDQARPRTIFPDLIYRLHVTDSVVPDYLVLFLSSRPARAQIMSNARGSSDTMPKISHDQIRSWQIPLPPVTTQREIVRHVQKDLSRTTELSRRAVKAIELLKERRSALISAAVTGKIDVREGAA